MFGFESLEEGDGNRVKVVAGVRKEVANLRQLKDAPGGWSKVRVENLN